MDPWPCKNMTTSGTTELRNLHNVRYLIKKNCKILQIPYKSHITHKCCSILLIENIPVTYIEWHF